MHAHDRSNDTSLSSPAGTSGQGSIASNGAVVALAWRGWGDPRCAHGCRIALVGHTTNKSCLFARSGTYSETPCKLLLDPRLYFGITPDLYPEDFPECSDHKQAIRARIRASGEGLSRISNESSNSYPCQLRQCTRALSVDCGLAAWDRKSPWGLRGTAVCMACWQQARHTMLLLGRTGSHHGL